MPFSWPRPSMLDLFNRALLTGSASVELDSNYKANLFRFALINLRRRNKTHSQTFSSLSISVSNKTVTIFKPTPIEIVRTWEIDKPDFIQGIKTE